MHLPQLFLLCDNTVIPHSFELFYSATEAPTVATVMRMTAERDIAHRANHNAYTTILTQWCDRQTQPLPQNARDVIALATQAAAHPCCHQDSSAMSIRTVNGDREQQPDDDFELFWFDVRDCLPESALNTSIPRPRRPDAPFSALVADSDQRLRQAIATWLTQVGAATVHKAATMAEARAHALPRSPHDLAILNLEQPDGSGIELVTDLRNHGWRRIVVLASPDHRHTMPLAFQAGAQACLLKPTSLSDDFRRIPDSDADTEPNDAPILDPATSAINPTSTPHDLSAREVEILKLVAAGNSNKEIGETLNRSALTIKSHLSRIGRKLGTGNRARMVVHAMRANIIS